MLQAQGKIIQQVKQGLLSVTIVRVKGIWQGSALSLRGQEILHGSRKRCCLFKHRKSGQVLDEEQLAFLADPRVTDGQDTQRTITYNAAFQTDDLDAYDSDCDDIYSTKAVLMANLSSYDLDVLSDVPNSETYQTDDMINQSFFKWNLQEKENKYIDKEIDLENKIKELDNIVYKVGQSPQTVHMLMKPQVFYDDTRKQALGYKNSFYLKKAQRIKPILFDVIVISKKHDVISVDDSEETLILEEESR
ncbi:hypothetical protein Tco_0308644 [Tanacetum coccineum]